MNTPYSTEWWRWKMYRQIAEYLHQPSVQGQTGIHALLQAYRKQREPARPQSQDEHEWGLEWR